MPRTGNQPESNQADNPLFFYMPDAEWGEFCQWHEPSFTISKAEISDLVGYTVDETDPNGAIAFNCAEQFMMCCKAARFHDIPSQDQVLADQIKSAVVETGNKAKFGHVGSEV
ncbi:hypothetical protein CCUS01_12473 [Colletotrichum cuscutae]|uniref:NADAR domain-containing protein n=1 Tax=Colletotrichum cuscutae TaxID=1209917 RepID=A0AAI9TU17_9PEZI|nr:hypothetical protein CCUS01_12473 [Colletotrichum cuscutae]